ncbi:CBL-interacting serine/threonine-protein kinase 21 [Raphanus sativus]|uniref:non-specific serine/threonine protein kinase n=1 Tax=Raphanus sativus TaxID=3726 RepID=A0A6J0MPK9_RAPSA|nr:CBL-interacting serine/threonine-protein kinase 21 [Raphanus sativus]XP_056861694.1 CBL-interacting serine/threonine-protein kinase 21 [Raphanus sativus]KAJ4907808.1 CBL-interacting serine/threonine-protein kinase 21 [Raphanus sativus]
MGLFGTKKIGKYEIGRTIGEGNFAKVKLGYDTTNGTYVAVKIIDKALVIQKGLQSQVQREIRTMKLLNHPNIVQIHEVIGTKTKICIVMEYVAGGQLSDKLCRHKMKESDARKLFQQLIDAVDYCHNRGVYHRDLKPQNLLLDSKGNLKVSDFGLSAVPKSGDMLSTACGSPCYIAPELIMNKGYSGAAVDVWSCGVILFELLAGYPPFDDHTLVVLYKKILRADYTFPPAFTGAQKKLIFNILDPNPQRRMKLAEIIIQDSWFKLGYIPAYHQVPDSIKESVAEINAATASSNFINAFQIIAMSSDLDLSGLLEEQDVKIYKTKIGSKNTAQETIKKIEAAATYVSLSVERIKHFKVKIQPKEIRSRSSFDLLSAEVIEVTPTNCVIEISKSPGELRLYMEFCQSLSSLLTAEVS